MPCRWLIRMPEKDQSRTAENALMYPCEKVDDAFAVFSMVNNFTCALFILFRPGVGE